MVLLAAIGHRLWFGSASINNLVLILLIFLGVISILFDTLASTLGAKKLGASWRGMAGAIIGGLVGLFFSLPGILIGPFVGAVLFESMGGREFKQALRAGGGAFLGVVAGAAGKFAICVAMTVVFAANVVYRSLF
jgi:uncharacterized protein YqgC (DUF456 family)